MIFQPDRFTQKVLFFSVFILIAVIGTFLLLDFSQSFADSHETKRTPVTDEPKYTSRINYSSKIHPQIIKIMDNSQPEFRARSLGTSFQNNELHVYVYLKPEFAKNPPSELNILAQDDNIVSTRLSFNEIQSLSDLESVEGIGLPIKPIPRGHIVSEGVAFSFADDLQATGITGNGVTVAVIDAGFDTTNSEISGNIGSTSFEAGCGNMLCGETAGDSHGTAVAEAIVDMAPDVTLRLHATLTSVGVNNAIDFNYLGMNF